MSIELPSETLGMVDVLLKPQFEAEARHLIDGGLQSADPLFLLGVHLYERRACQVLLREETDSTGRQMYWIHCR